jgi:hypothetical protein
VQSRPRTVRDVLQGDEYDEDRSFERDAYRRNLVTLFVESSRGEVVPATIQDPRIRIQSQQCRIQRRETRIMYSIPRFRQQNYIMVMYEYMSQNARSPRIVFESPAQRTSITWAMAAIHSCCSMAKAECSSESRGLTPSCPFLCPAAWNQI